MHVETFDPKERIVWVDVRLFGPMGVKMLRFVLDTGTPVTVVRTSAVDELGYSARMGTARSRLIGVDGVQEGYARLAQKVRSCRTAPRERNKMPVIKKPLRTKKRSTPIQVPRESRRSRPLGN